MCGGEARVCVWRVVRDIDSHGACVRVPRRVHVSDVVARSLRRLFFYSLHFAFCRAHVCAGRVHTRAHCRPGCSYRGCCGCCQVRGMRAAPTCPVCTHTQRARVRTRACMLRPPTALLHTQYCSDVRCPLINALATCDRYMTFCAFVCRA